MSILMTKDSVYGKRDGALNGLALIRKGNPTRSVFLNTRGWKTGCVHGIEMLGRQDMFKPEPFKNYYVLCAAYFRSNRSQYYMTLIFKK